MYVKYCHYAIILVSLSSLLNMSTALSCACVTAGEACMSEMECILCVENLPHTS